MLVLSRKSGQSLTVGEAKLTFIVKGSSVKVCIDAPREVLVVRGELGPRDDDGKAGGK